ncbi:META domain-containing protein [Streptomyces sp. NPDC057271]|uniref:META domain-containing protein n=1 Tax=unclassified Streptomyces TaxID=2593676 RepID=UPI003626D0AE
MPPARPIAMLKPRTTAATTAVASLLLLAACGTENAGSDPGAGSVAPDVPVTGVHWTVDSLTVDGRKTPAPAGAFVEIDRDGRAKGNSGCNHFGATVTVDGDTLKADLGETTEMACGAMDFEAAFHKAFDGPLKARLSGEKLTLTTPDGTTSLALSAEPPAPLNGTTWTVDSLLSGDTAVSPPKGSEGKATFVIDEDGRVRGNLGCNRFTATAKVTAETLTVTGPVATTRMICSGPQMELETKLYELLDGPLSYELRHRTLTLTGPDGEGFAATAKPAPSRTP